MLGSMQISWKNILLFRSKKMSQSEDVGDGNKKAVKKTPNDFIFGKVIGEGSYSTVSM